MRLFTLSLIALAIVPVAGHAQTARSGAAPISSATQIHVANGPTIQSAAIGIQRAPANVATASSLSKAPRRSAAQHNVALVVVGAGAMVAGSFIDGTAGTMFMVGGAIIGLYGLFHLLQ